MNSGFTKIDGLFVIVFHPKLGISSSLQTETLNHGSLPAVSLFPSRVSICFLDLPKIDGLKVFVCTTTYTVLLFFIYKKGIE